MSDEIFMTGTGQWTQEEIISVGLEKFIDEFLNTKIGTAQDESKIITIQGDGGSLKIGKQD